MSADDKTEQQNVEDVADLEPSDGVEIDKTAADKDDEADEADEAQQEDDTTLGLGDKGARGRRVKVAPLILVLLLLLSGALVPWLYVVQYRRDEQTDTAAAQTAIKAARDGTVALLSYKPDPLN